MTRPAESHLLLVISAPSGGGKTTLCQGLLRQRRNLSRAITCTTRAPRPTETDGVDYHFLTEAAFRSRIAAADFIEHANVFGNLYGTPRSSLMRQLEEGDVLLAIDVQGAAALRAQSRHDEALRGCLVTVFLAPPSISELGRRLRARRQDDPDTIERRLKQARREIEACRHFDYVILSHSVEEDLRITSCILDAETWRRHRVRLPDYDASTAAPSAPPNAL